ncbi:MAG TPA: C45 family autoproteolytic acyltransferase/hydrolase [Gemmataceae bacterium]|nr:C45 family autoproteolytic acyltransferase/hydrolase [Gemmataceae bacterium]
MQRPQLSLLGMSAILAAALLTCPSRAASNSSDFRPDPKSVQRYGPAYRYPQDGWIVLHIEGKPYERGYQHGRLLAPEIAAFLRCSANMISPRAPSEGWKNARSLINALFVRRYEKEYLEEMRGIADGATAAGARYDGRPIDLVDIVGLNVWPEIETLDSALEATPTGLEGMRFQHAQPRAVPAPKPMHCSAFAATGPATADGKVVFGHITMFGLYPSYFYNVWLDVKPSQGHRVFIQSYPGGIQSGLDYYMNDVGILVAETTIAQTHFEINGMSVASRIRQALQYADSIDKAVDILKTANNGLYTNEWLLADVKTNEIAMFELGTAKSRLYRSSKDDWFGGTRGFYWGCNNTKDLDVRLETIPGVHGRPANMVFCPSDRDQMWQQLFEKHKGKIGVDFGKEAFTTPPIAAYHSLDAKFTTTDMAKEFKTWALFGPPLGRTWQPTNEERGRFPEIQPLVSNPWTVLHGGAPALERESGPLAVDVPEPIRDAVHTAILEEENKAMPTTPVWHGTILPKTDADIWLATAFADYERLVANEAAMHEREEASGNEKAEFAKGDREKLASALFGYRGSYLASARAFADVPLTKTVSDLTRSEWYRVASGKGLLLLHELRHQLGNAAFDKMMDSFGREHAGQQVSTAEFQAHVERAAGKPMQGFFDTWLQQPGLARLGLDKVSVEEGSGEYKVGGEILCSGHSPQTSVQVTLETSAGEETKTVGVHGPRTPFTFTTRNRPERLTVDKYGQTAKANGGVFSVSSFYGEVDKALIVYGTAAELPTNREAARELQRAIRTRHSNFTAPIKTDKEVTDQDLKSHHLLLIGRPDSNLVVQRFHAALPIAFGSRSFTVRHETYAHAQSAVCAAAENPLNPRYSLVVVAGLSPEATLHAAPALLTRSGGHGTPEVLVLPNKMPVRALIVPAPELVKDLNNGNSVTSRRDATPSGGR